jgi:trk/ktr system potassium uptake protein
MSVETLSYAVRLRVVGVHLGQLGFLVGCLSLPPGLFALLEGDWRHALGCLIVASALTGGGYPLSRLRVADDIQQNEALVVVAAVFVVTPIAFSLPLAMSGLSYADALFEAVSGITTAGLSTLASVEDKPRSVIFTATWLQWIGGVGFMVLTFTLLFGQSATARRLVSVLGDQKGIIGGTRAYALITIRIYSTLTLVGLLLLLASGRDLFAATTLTFSAVSTGGFAPYDASLGGLGAGTQTLVILLSVAGALALPLYFEVWRGNWRTFFRDPEFRALFIVGALIALLLVLHGAGGATSFQLVLTAFSAQSTAGFMTVPVTGLDGFSKAVLIIAMIVGGGIGSSAGGLKLLRVLVLIGLVQLLIRKTRLAPHALVTTTIAGRDWEGEELLRVLAVIGLFAGTIAVSWLAFLWYGYAPLDALFEVVSATGTVGLSSGLTEAALAPGLKFLLCVDMLLGRLEILPVLVLLAPRTWIGHRRKQPTEDPP